MSNMSPSETITSGQIGKVLDLLTAALRKSGLPATETQEVLETQGKALADEFLVAFRNRIESTRKLIRRVVRVIRNRTPQAMLDATGRRQYVDERVVAAMPRGKGDEAAVVFFQVGQVGRYVSNTDLEKEYGLRGLVPADPYALGAVNEADPAFADDHPNATYWKDKDGNWCYEAFRGSEIGERHVTVDRRDLDWSDYWSFGGVRK